MDTDPSPYDAAFPMSSSFAHAPRPGGAAAVSRVPAFALLALSLVFGPTARAQTTGRVLGRVVEAGSGAPVATAEVSIEGTEIRVLTSERGDFILPAVPTGERELRVERLGFRPHVVVIRVRPARATQLIVELTPAPLEVEGITAEVERVRLIEPDVTVSHELVIGGELRQLPVDEVEEAIELTTGVSGGHFRGGRIGQEVYQIDGLEIKNQLEASRGATGLELAPSALAEIDVVTGGFGAQDGSALSGVVRYATRKGDVERWDGRLALLTDHWAPDGLFRGFSSLSASAGGPLPFLGDRSTAFADILVQGFVDADPRARGLTCLRPEDGDEALALEIQGLRRSPRTDHLYCPYSAARLPHQRGDKLIGFLRIDRPLSAATNLTLSLLHNRRQQELYTPEFKYNREHQLGQRTKGYLANLALDWSRHGTGRAYHVVARTAVHRLDRYLGALAARTLGERSSIGNFGLEDFRFLGEDAARSPIEEQLATGAALPGYTTPGGSTGSPFGPAAEGIFFTRGTPGLANWNRTDFLAADLDGEVLYTEGHAVQAGINTRFYRVESYERAEAYLPGSLPSYARFYPTTLSAYLDASLLAAHDVTIQAGLRFEAFQSGLSFQRDRQDFLSPVIDTDWHAELMPRLGVAVPVPGTGNRTVFRFNYGLVAQPPDFRFFLDTTVGDSLRTDIRRQGNPNLAFERGTAWEAGATQLLGERVSLSATAYYKDLRNLVTSGLTLSDVPENRFSTGDFGTVKGIELRAQALWTGLHIRAGYAVQSARGVTSSAFEDPADTISDLRIEFPLAFDRRHAADLVVTAGRAARAETLPWSLVLTGSLASGVPVNRLEPELSGGVPVIGERTPWTARVNLRTSYELGSLPGCRRCAWRIVLDGRNVIGRENVLALRRDTGDLAPALDDLLAVAREVPDDMVPIPVESPRYSALADLDRDGRITADEMETARFGAALDRHDPSLFFGAARELRLGVEVVF